MKGAIHSVKGQAGRSALLKLSGGNSAQILQTDNEILKAVADSYKTFCHGGSKKETIKCVTYTFNEMNIIVSGPIKNISQSIHPSVDYFLRKFRSIFIFIFKYLMRILHQLIVVKWIIYVCLFKSHVGEPS